MDLETRLRAQASRHTPRQVSLPRPPLRLYEGFGFCPLYSPSGRSPAWRCAYVQSGGSCRAAVGSFLALRASTPSHSGALHTPIRAHPSESRAEFCEGEPEGFSASHLDLRGGGGAVRHTVTCMYVRTRANAGRADPVFAAGRGAGRGDSESRFRAARGRNHKHNTGRTRGSGVSVCGRQQLDSGVQQQQDSESERGWVGNPGGGRAKEGGRPGRGPWGAVNAMYSTTKVPAILEVIIYIRQESVRGGIVQGPGNERGAYGP